MDRSEADLAEADNVKLQCERDWRQLKDTQAILQGLPAVPVATGSSINNSAIGDEESSGETSEACLLQILHEHEKRLKAELHTLQERQLKTLPESKELQQLILQQDQIKRLDQLKDTLTFLHAKEKEVTEELKDEKEACASLSNLNSTLKAKVAALDKDEASNDEGRALESVLKDLTSKMERVNKVNKYFKTTLKRLLTTHFQHSQRPVTSKELLNESRDVDMDSAVSMKSLVGRLIEQCLNSPQQPYIEIDETILPQHVEFLLRCQAVLKDPENSRRIKLVPFHL